MSSPAIADDETATVAGDSTDVCMGESPATDVRVLVGSSGGQDNMPLHLRVFKEVVVLDDMAGKFEEATEGNNVVVDRLLVLEVECSSMDDSVNAEPRTTLEDFADTEEALETDPRTALDVLMDAEE